MSTKAKLTPAPPLVLPKWLLRILPRGWFQIAFGAVILVLDLFTGPYLLFPILFVLPVSFAAWFCGSRLAYSLAVLLPIGRLLIAEFVDHPAPHAYIFANAFIRILVLLFLAYLVDRTARQTRQLEERVAGLVTMCAWSRTIEYEGQWISFEEYLKRRFNLETSHGISPVEAAKIFGHVGAPPERTR